MLKVQYVIVVKNVHKWTTIINRMQRDNSFDVNAKTSRYCVAEISAGVSMLSSKLTVAIVMDT